MAKAPLAAACMVSSGMRAGSSSCRGRFVLVVVLAALVEVLLLLPPLTALVVVVMVVVVVVAATVELAAGGLGLGPAAPPERDTVAIQREREGTPASK
jgi:hypothetical protein